jgi:mono/diheme cytochrome c family protein
MNQKMEPKDRGSLIFDTSENVPYTVSRTVTKLSIFLLLALAVFLTIPSLAAERQMVQLLVPADKLAEARALTSPLPNSPETAAQGKAIYVGKGGCVRCHGKEGDGNGPLAARLSPSPRNFKDQGFWKLRTEGEVFWLIKNGSLDTGLVGYGDQLTDEEIWALIQYLRSFTGEHGPA